MELRPTLLVATGGFAGALSRHAVSVLSPETFPFGTLLVNVVGAFVLGSIVYHTRYDGRMSDRTRLLVSTGFVSSFTTYSTFAAETVALDPSLAALNIVANYALGFVAVLAAREVVRWRS